MKTRYLPDKTQIGLTLLTAFESEKIVNKIGTKKQEKAEKLDCCFFIFSCFQ
jgi:hypothetical protein